MKTYVFEGVQDHGTPLNWGKFLVGVPDVEWTRHSEVSAYNQVPLLEQIGWTPQHIWVCDLATGEGAWFRLGGHARADLEKHRIWVCPLFEEFLTWLYEQSIETLHLLPRVVELPDAQFSINGYRRLGPHDVSFTLRKGDLIQVEWSGEIRTVVCDGLDEHGGTMIRSLSAEEAAQLGRHEGPSLDMIDPGEPDPAAVNTAQRAAQTGLERAEDADTAAQLAHEEQVAAELYGNLAEDDTQIIDQDDVPTQVIRGNGLR